MQGHVVNAQLLQQLIRHRQQLHIGLRLARADHLGVDLVELAVAALLRALVAEQRAVGGDLERRILLPAIGEVGARDARGELRAQGERIPAAVLEGIHLLRHHIGRLAQRTREHLGLFEHRHFHPAEAVQPPHALEGFDHEGESLGIGAEDVLGAADGLRCLLAHGVSLKCGGRLGPRGPFRNPVAPIKGRRVTPPLTNEKKRTFMRIDKIPTGVNPPDDLNVIIEVPTGGEPVKYEFDKESGALFVDRILHTPMRYPANYGFVPHTLSPDGDPLDALVIARSPFIPGCVVRARPIGVLNLEDEQGGDEKLVCVPVNETFPYYADVIETSDLPDIICQQIEHFFTHYKDLETEKWVRVGKWGDAAEARKITLEAIERYQAA